MKDGFELEVLRLGLLQTNCYILKNKETGAAVIVDPAETQRSFKEAVEAEDIRPEAVLLTHGHYDHVGAVPYLREQFPDIRIICGKEEQPLMRGEIPGTGPASPFPKRSADAAAAVDHWTEDGEILHLAGTDFRVLATPGHTAGSVCYFNEENGLLFSGDTLFCGSCGRVDLVTGSSRAMRQSLGRLKKEIRDDVEVLPGHESTSDMGYEKTYNPYMAMA